MKPKRKGFTRSFRIEAYRTLANDARWLADCMEEQINTSGLDINKHLCRKRSRSARREFIQTLRLLGFIK